MLVRTQHVMLLFTVKHGRGILLDLQRHSRFISMHRRLSRMTFHYALPPPICDLRCSTNILAVKNGPRFQVVETCRKKRAVVRIVVLFAYVRPGGIQDDRNQASGPFVMEYMRTRVVQCGVQPQLRIHILATKRAKSLFSLLLLTWIHPSRKK